jgi:hypothetical protein
MTEVIQVSYSELKDARQCSAKHEWGWRFGYRRTHREDCDCALCMGIAWHEALNCYYDGLRGSYTFLSKGNGKYMTGSKGGWHAALDYIENVCPGHLRERIRWMIEGYAAQYGREPGWTVKATEHQIIVPLPQIYTDLRVLLKVKIDLIIADPQGKLWVDDHKTCAQLPTENKQVDPQLPLYMYALKNGDVPWPAAFGARYSYALKPPKTMKFKKQRTLEERFRRRLVSHSDKEIFSIARDAYISIYMRYMEARLFDKPPRSIGPECSYTCDFVTACKASRKGYRVAKFLEDEGFNAYRLADPKMPKEIE